jgi:hypothetical protein
MVRIAPQVDGVSPVDRLLRTCYRGALSCLTELQTHAARDEETATQVGAEKLKRVARITVTNLGCQGA